MWGWDVTITGRHRRSFTTIRHASETGFTIGGDGTTTVTTAASFRLYERVLVTVADRTSEVRADRLGRVTVSTVLDADGVAVNLHRRYSEA